MEIDSLTDRTFSLTLETHATDSLSSAQPSENDSAAASTSSAGWKPSSTLWGALNPDPSAALAEILLRHGPSDLIIRTSDGGEYHVHKRIVCGGSKFFDNAANGPFKASRDLHHAETLQKVLTSSLQEARTGVIELFHDPPAAVRLLLQFLYTGKYNYFVNDHDEPSAPLCLFHLDVYILGALYQLSKLKKLARASFLTSLFERKALVNSVMPLAISTLYQSTPESDRELRDFFENYTIRHMAMLLQLPSFLELMLACAPYRRAVARATHGQRGRVARLENHIADLQVQIKIPEFEAKETSQKYRCPTKGCRGMMRSPRLMNTDDVYCVGCNTISEAAEWKVDENRQRRARLKK